MTCKYFFVKLRAQKLLLPNMVWKIFVLWTIHGRNSRLSVQREKANAVKFHGANSAITCLGGRVTGLYWFDLKYMAFPKLTEREASRGDKCKLKNITWLNIRWNFYLEWNWGKATRDRNRVNLASNKLQLYTSMETSKYQFLTIYEFKWFQI